MKTRRRRDKLLTLFTTIGITFISASMLLGTASSAPTVKEVKVGAIHPLTGFLARTGGQLKEGIDIAVEEINAAGGIKSLGGAKLVVSHADSQGKAEVGQAETERLIQEGMAALLGCFQSAVTFNSTQIAERAKVPFLVTIAVADDITARGFKYTFRFQPNVTASVKSSLDGLRTLDKMTGQSLKTAVYMYEDSIFGTGLANLAKKYGPDYGIQILDIIGYSTRGLTDLTVEVARAKALKPDVLLASGYMEDGILMIRTAWELGLDVKCIYAVQHGAFGEPEFAKKVGGLAEGTFSAGLHWNPAKPEVLTLVNRYEAKYKQPFSYLAAYGYQAIYIITNAIERAKSLDHKAIRDALAKTNYKDHIMPFPGPITFDERGENPRGQILLSQILGGRECPIWPEQFSKCKPTLPMPGWIKK